MASFDNIRQVADFYNNNIYPKWLDYYKLYYGDLRDRQQYLKDWQSNIPAKILARIIDTFWSRIYDNAFRFYVSPNSNKDVDKVKVVQDLLTRAIQVSGLKNKFLLSAKDALLLGEGYGRIKYTISKKKVSYINPVKGKKEYYIENKQYPDYVYISPFNIMLDPTAQTFDDIRYVVYRRLMTEQDINNEYSVLLGGKVKGLGKLKNKDTAQYLFDTDWLISKNDALYNSSVSDYITDETLTFDKNKYYEVVEYWENNKLVIFVNGYKLYEGDNPLPIKGIPFIQLTFNKDPGSIRGTGLAFQLEHIERMGVAVVNAFLDDLKLKSVPVYKRRVGLSAIKGVDNVIDINPGDTIFIEDPNDLTIMELGRLNYDIQNVYTFLINEAMMIAGVNDIVMGGPLMKVDRSATSTAGRIESFKARMLTFFDSINRNLGKIAEYWLAMIVAYNKGGEFTYKIFDDKTKQTIFEKIKLEDIEGQFDVIFDTQQLKSALRDVALQKKMNFLQIASQLAIDPITKQPVVDLKKLVDLIAYDLDLPDVLVDYNKQNTDGQQTQQQSKPQPQQQDVTKLIAQKLGQQPDNKELMGDNTMAQNLLQEALNPTSGTNVG